MNIYSTNFKRNSIVLKNNLRISKFFPFRLKLLIEEKVPENNFILGVTYKSGDSQICISGHPKEKETLLEGTERELMEELCLKSKAKINFCLKDGLNHFCFIDIKDTDIVNNSFRKIEKDSRNRSIICVYGEEKDILLYLSKVRYNLDNEDKIVSIWSASKETIMEYINCEDNDYISNN